MHEHRILELQSPYLPEPDFRALALPYVRRIHDLTGESATMLKSGIFPLSKKFWIFLHLTQCPNYQIYTHDDDVHLCP
jgi:hypothetical protein